MVELTEMMKHYLSIKEKYKDAFVFYRLGDFYEMFFDDAEKASRILALTLTGRDCGLTDCDIEPCNPELCGRLGGPAKCKKMKKMRAPMCGVPHHSVNGYIGKLINKGYKVAICEQMTDPKDGPVEREVVRVITPGTVIDEDILNEKINSFILSVITENRKAGLAWCDVSTGEFFIKESTMKELKSDLELIAPSEIIMCKSVQMQLSGASIENFDVISQTVYEDWAFEYTTALSRLLNHFEVTSMDAFGCADLKLANCAAGALVEYLHETQKTSLKHINRIRIAAKEGVMALDSATRKNLELTHTIRNATDKGSLLGLIDKTCTSMGGRKLRSFVEQPLTEIYEINMRLDAVQALVNEPDFPLLRERLKSIYDIERLCSKVSYNKINAKDCISLRQSIARLPDIKNITGRSEAKLLQELSDGIDVLSDISDLLNRAIGNDVPTSIKEGGMIREGYNKKLDELKDISIHGLDKIGVLQKFEQEQTGIKNLKIEYNRVFGYYIEVTKSNYDLVPYRYKRKQTLTNCERYITDELKELEAKILGAEEQIIDLEYNLFLEIRDYLAEQIKRIQKTAEALAYIDVLQSMANVARSYGYVRPEMATDGRIEIKDGRHPVVESVLPSGGFIPNDTLLDNDENRTIIITGPNMAGKSTYMRQVAMITMMAQMGSFVPARSAHLSVCDRVFTRVGASDDLSSGQSTFMVEMNEVANILNNATSDSLIVLDEIGRGTSTFDGLSIAWAVTEYINNKRIIGAKTLFSTHYHELTELEKTLSGVKTYSISVKELGEDVVFLRRIVRGGAKRSFGIYVAKLAGLPKQVISRAKVLLTELEANSLVKEEEKQAHEDNAKVQQLGMLSINEEDIINKLRNVDVSQITPINAMNILYELSEQISELDKQKGR